MASRLPIVATRVGGNPELVREGENGFLVPYGDAQALAEALRALLSAPEQAREMGLRGRRRVESALSMEMMAEGHGALYRRALGGAPVVREAQLRAGPETAAPKPTIVPSSARISSSEDHPSRICSFIELLS